MTSKFTPQPGRYPRHYNRSSIKAVQLRQRFFINFQNISICRGRVCARPFVLVKKMSKEFAKSFYSSKTWQDCRNEYMKRAHYLCEDCMRRGIYKPAKEVHHIEELTPENIHRPEIALSFDNLVALCKECHKARHNEREKGRRYLFGDNGEVILK